MPDVRNLNELTSTDEPAWPEVQQWLAKAAQEVQTWPVRREEAERALLALQVSVRSPMGALAWHTGGLSVARGWLRVYGGGSAAMPRTVASWTLHWQPVDAPQSPRWLLVADDVLGGAFAINGGGLPGQPGHVCYFAPDQLAWETLGLGYSDFLTWAMSDRLDLFYPDQRWTCWEKEVATLKGDQGLSIYPFLWAEGPEMSQRARQAVPMEELFGLQFEMAGRL